MSTAPILSGLSTSTQPSAISSPPGWRPPQWKNSPQTVITIPAASVPSPALSETSFTINYDTGGSDSGGSGTPAAVAPTLTAPTIYVFDAILKASHQAEVKLTEYPVQTQANVSNHAMRMPSHLVLSIGMSDVMASYTAGTWTGSTSKSVSAYLTMLALEKAMVLVNITTRLVNYVNMMLINVSADDSNATGHGLRATLTFRELFLAELAGSSSASSYGPTVNNSSRTHVTAATQSGTASTQNPSSTVIAQNAVAFSIPSSVSSPSFGTSMAAAANGAPQTVTPTVQGAGSWTSNAFSWIVGPVF